MSTQEIFNYRKVNDLLITGGQPTEEQLISAAREGFRAVVNLATYDPDRSLPDEASLVRSLSMDYYAIPVEWENPTMNDFEAFEKLVEQLGPVKTLIHCAANFRVTAFYSIYAQRHLGWSPNQAEAFRMSVWQDSHYPIWERFIQNLPGLEPTIGAS